MPLATSSAQTPAIGWGLFHVARSDESRQRETRVADKDPAHYAPTTRNSSAPILARLEDLPRAHRTSSGAWTARCPAHEDAHPSLGWSIGSDGRVLLRCHAGCSTEAIVSGLGARMSDLFVSSHPGVGVRAERIPQLRRYEIRDVEGSLQAVHVRREIRGGKKFSWECPDGNPGLAGRSVRSLPFYRTETIKGTALDEPVIVTEGEKATITLATIWPGLIVATVTGAASIPSADVLEVLRDRPVILWPDRDVAGARHMERLARALRPIVSAVRILDVPGLPEHGDAADYVGAGRGRDELRELIDAASPLAAHTPSPSRAETGLRFRTAREIANSTPASVAWRAKPYLIDGAVLEVVGKIKAAGKTTFVTFMCRAVLDGADFLGESTVQGGVVYLTEQPDASLRETLRRAGLLERDDFVVLSWNDTDGLSWPEVVDHAVGEAERRRAKVLVVDTLSRFAGIQGDGENHAGEADAASAPLIRAAARGLAVVAVRHERKAGGDVGDSGRGSSAFGGAVDTVIAVRRGEGRSSNVRVISALSRFDGVPEMLVVELTDAGYVSHGSDTDVAVAEAMATIQGLLASTPAGLTVAQLRELVPRTTAQRAIDRLAADGHIERRGAGVKGDPYHFVTGSSESSEGEVPAPPLPLNLGIFGDDEEWGMGTA